MRINKILTAAAALFLLALGACDKTESYSELYNDEEKAVNWYLSNQRVRGEVPPDSIFEIGSEAPFYRLDEDGFVYMQVINRGDMNDRPKKGDRVYFRFVRRNIKSMWQGITPDPEGNTLGGAFTATSFIFGNDELESTLELGTGIQLPLNFLGYNSEVNIVLRSNSGFSSDQSQCNPYLVNIQYFKAEY